MQTAHTHFRTEFYSVKFSRRKSLAAVELFFYGRTVAGRFLFGGFSAATAKIQRLGSRAGREGEGGEERLTVMCNWNRAADWLRPALRLKLG